ncbi:MAG TPA: hypothetical protein PK228_10515 [Saprospiraceae bacterium]|nr:hypothetical protein [Saprospiraceae bacterium]
MRILSTLLIGLFHFQFTYANGGPVNPASVVRVGDVELLNMPNVELVREDLHIRIEGEYSVITVRYLLRSHDYKTDTMLYGFPVDFLMGEWSEKFEWQPDFVPSFEILMDKKPLPVRSQTDFSVMHDTFNTIDNNFRGKYEKWQPEAFRRKWFFTEFVLKKENPSELEVRYRIKNHSNDFATTKDFFPSFSQRSFRYDFTPAAYWGEGKVGEFNVTVDDSEVTRCNGRFKISGLDFQRNSEGILTFNEKNFALEKAEDLRFSLEMDEKFRSDYVREHQFPRNMIHKMYASSTLSGGNYSVDNLLDGNFSTAWVEGQNNNGTGAWVEFELLPGYELETVAIANGYTKSQETYDNNNRLKSLRVEFEFTSDQSGETEIFSDTLSFTDLPWQQITDYNLAGICPIFKDGFEWYMDPVRRVRLTILETWPGKKYNDTCISEVLLLGWKIPDAADK